jgi:hypothetical protein
MGGGQRTRSFSQEITVGLLTFPSLSNILLSHLCRHSFVRTFASSRCSYPQPPLPLGRQPLAGRGTTQLIQKTWMHSFVWGRGRNLTQEAQKGRPARCTTRGITSVRCAHGREIHAVPNKARHACERPRDGERAVSRERSASCASARLGL